MKCLQNYDKSCNSTMVVDTVSDTLVKMKVKSLKGFILELTRGFCLKSNQALLNAAAKYYIQLYRSCNLER